MAMVSEALRHRIARSMDSDLVTAARAGEMWAAEALYVRHRKMVQRIASRLAHAHDRDDLVQDSFLAALGSLHKIQNPELFGSWLAAVVTRTAAHEFQRRRAVARRDRAGLAPEHLASRAAPPDVLAELGRISRLLERLPVEARRVFILRRVERMSNEEVAARMGRSLATVKRRFAHAQRVLDRRLLRAERAVPA
jgi:RNA polymerase sigma-70 factor (ECF subfamily)